MPKSDEELIRLREALEWIAGPARELEAKKSVMLSGPFGPARTIQAMQKRAREALGQP